VVSGAYVLLRHRGYVYMTGMTLTEWRKSRGLSLRAAGEVLGVSHVRVIQYERGDHSPRLRTVDQIERKTGGAVTRMDWPKEAP
jgi:transcriptional regulator with XRE-family HTH domain